MVQRVVDGEQKRDSRGLLSNPSIISSTPAPRVVETCTDGLSVHTGVGWTFERLVRQPLKRSLSSELTGGWRLVDVSESILITVRRTHAAGETTSV